MRIEFFVPGKSRPGGSKTPCRNKRTGKLYCRDSGGMNTKKWRAVVALYAGQVRPRKLFAGPLCVVFRFQVERPKKHYINQDRERGRLKHNAPQYPTTQPDVLKLARAAEDALTGIIYTDDSIIVDEPLSKRYSDTPGVRIIIIELEPHGKG